MPQNDSPNEQIDAEDNCDAHSLGSWKDGAEVNTSVETPSQRICWADMAQEDDEFGEEENSNNGITVVVGDSNDTSDVGTVVAEKPTLPREQREYIRFMNVRRKKDFICFERVNGKLVNILEGLELHTGIFSAAEQKRIVSYVASLQEMGKRGELKGLWSQFLTSFIRLWFCLCLYVLCGLVMCFCFVVLYCLVSKELKGNFYMISLTGVQGFIIFL